MTADRFTRRGLRRPPAVHRRPTAPAPETPEEVLERAPDVSRETTAKDAESAAWAAIESQAVPLPAGATLEELANGAPPPLRKDQVARLEALTALWERSVRLEGPPDATMLYASPRQLPPVPSRPVLEVVRDEPPAPVPDAAEVADRSRELLEEEAAAEARAAHRPPVQAPAPDPGRDGEPGPARVSDWTSRHDPRSLEFPVRQRLARAVPLDNVSLPAGPVLDQGTTPPLSLRDASACVGMACAAAANVLELRNPDGRDPANAWAYGEEDARRLYFRAQDLDARSGHDYGGTSVLAGMKSGMKSGLWAGYLWALGGTKDIAQVLLQLRVAVVVGIPWSAGLEDPDRYGVIRPGGADAGGHCLAVVGLKLGMLGGSPGPWFELQQSRGEAEGIGGRVYLHHTALARLLGGQGEAGVPLPAELLQ